MPASNPTPVPFIPAGKDPGDASLQDTILSEKCAWKGDIFTVGIMEVEMPNKKRGRRDVAHHKGAVAIVALTDENRVCLVRQYRPILGRVSVEIPAGKLEADESPLECASRELLEETGYEAEKLVKLTTIATSPGFTDERIHLFCATGLTYKGAKPDEDEFLHVDLVPADQFIDAALEGQLEDAKTVLAAYALEVIGNRMQQQAARKEQLSQETDNRDE